MRLAWYSNSPWASTGYGNQTKLMLPLLADRLGVGQVASISNFGHQGTVKRESGIRHYPMGWHPYSDDVAPVHATHFFDGQPGWVVTLFDVWVFENPMWRSLNLASWVPVDHQPVPPKVVNWFKTFGAVPIAMSQFGADQLGDAGLEPLYAPHGIDVDVYRPVTVDDDGQAVRDVFDIPPDRFVVGMVANNKGNQPPRKGFGEAFLAFAKFLRHTPDALLYVHADDLGAHQGVNLMHLAIDCGIDDDHLRFTDGYTLRVGLPDERMAQLYSAFDVLLAPSYGEGFGIPVVEAQACGVPVIVSDFTAQSELCGSGWKVPCQPWYDHLQRSWFGVPATAAIVEALVEAAERSESERVAASAQARRFAQRYDHRQVFTNRWVPILDELEERLPGSWAGVSFAGPVAA